MSDVAIALIIAAACVCCALCGYGIAIAARRQQDGRDQVAHAGGRH